MAQRDTHSNLIRSDSIQSDHCWTQSRASLWRLGVFTIVLLAAFGLAAIPSNAQAQGLPQIDPGAICVSAFADTTTNGMRDPAEAPLEGVNVNLSTDSVIIATHLTTSSEIPFCFENLAPANYTVTFTDSPTYRITTANQGTYALASGQRLTIDQFGALPLPPEAWPGELDALIAQTTPTKEPLDSSVRLMFATVGSMVVMMFMIAVGAMLFGLVSRRRRQQAAVTGVYSSVERGPNHW